MSGGCLLLLESEDVPCPGDKVPT